MINTSIAQFYYILFVFVKLYSFDDHRLIKLHLAKPSIRLLDFTMEKILDCYGFRWERHQNIGNTNLVSHRKENLWQDHFNSLWDVTHRDRGVHMWSVIFFACRATLEKLNEIKEVWRTWSQHFNLQTRASCLLTVSYYLLLVTYRLQFIKYHSLGFEVREKLKFK